MPLLPVTELATAPVLALADNAYGPEIMRARVHSCQRCGKPFVYRYLILPHDLRVIDFLCQQCTTDVVDENPSVCSQRYQLADSS